MRVFVFAIDACEIDHVEGWGLEALKLDQYGTYPALVNEKTQLPMSAQVWGSFLTGQVQTFAYWQEVGSTWRPLTRFLSYGIIKWLWNFLGGTLTRRKIVKYRTRESLEGIPLDELLHRVRVLNFPFVNYDVEAILNLFETVPFGKWLPLMKTIATLNAGEVLRALKEDDWDVLLVYEPILDGAGHFNFPDKTELLRRAYTHVHDIAAQYREALPEDTLMLIVSDHGMKSDGSHSFRGFYSMTPETCFTPEKVTDFYDFIIQQTGEV